MVEANFRSLVELAHKQFEQRHPVQEVYCFAEEETFLLDLVIDPDVVLDERVLSFCLPMVMGEKTPIWRQRSYDPLCRFSVQGRNELILEMVNADRMFGDHWAHMIFDMVALALTVCEEGVQNAHPFAYSYDGMTTVFASREQAIQEFETLLHEVLSYSENQPYTGCDVTAHSFGVCCPRHRFLRAWRFQLFEWIAHFYDREWSEAFWAERGGKKTEFDENTQYCETPPADSWLRAKFAFWMNTDYQNDPQQFLLDTFAFAREYREYHIERPLHTCIRDNHLSHHCCALHRWSSFVYGVQDFWREYFDDVYNIFEYNDERGHNTTLGSLAGWKLFIEAADLNTSALVISADDWFHDLPEIDTSNYHRADESGFLWHAEHFGQLESLKKRGV